MEESIRTGIVSPDEYLERLFALEEKDWSQYSPLALAYLGDAVYDVVIRTIVVKRGNRQAHKLHESTTGIVRAEAQARAARAILPHLTTEEAAVYRRGRGAHPEHSAKNASRREYLEATGLEALIGYLYLARRHERLMDLIHTGLEETGFWPEPDRPRTSSAVSEEKGGERAEGLSEQR